MARSILIDTSIDLRQQALRLQIPRVDAVLYTHPHADHILGIDELRSYNYIQKASIPVYGSRWTQKELLEKFPYTFQKNVASAAIPSLDFHLIQSHEVPFDLFEEKVTPIPLPHGHQECLGYRLRDLAYLTDCHDVPPSAIERLGGLTTLFLDCASLTNHKTHLHLKRALQIIEQLKPQETYLTHLGHEIDYTVWSKQLPKNVNLAYDGLIVFV